MWSIRPRVRLWPSSILTRYFSVLPAPWRATVGLEMHVQLKDEVKLFSDAKAIWGARANTHVAAFDAALPGSMPRLQRAAVEKAVAACYALRCEVASLMKFDRKHYYYLDLPAGYQVTQRENPIGQAGVVQVKDDGGVHPVRIQRVQLEQDTGKLLHSPETEETLVDLNRAGAALIEIVTEPDMHSAEEAVAFVTKLRSLLRHSGASDAHMERGGLRCDANISLNDGHREHARVEVKNLNSLQFLKEAIDFEIKRQYNLLSTGETLEPCTRGYNERTRETFLMRKKETSLEYMYLEDPDLPPFVLDAGLLDGVRMQIGELPDAALERLQKQYGLSQRDAGILVHYGEADGDHQALMRFFEAATVNRDPQQSCNWILNSLLGTLSRHGIPFVESPVTVADVQAIFTAFDKGDIDTAWSRDALEVFIMTKVPMKAVLQDIISRRVPDDVVRDIARSTIAAMRQDPQRKQKKRRRGGGDPLLGVAIGEVARKVERRAPMDVIKSIVTEEAQRQEGKKDA